MWKSAYFVTLALCANPILSKFTSNEIIGKVIDRLDLTLDYVQFNYDKINVDCLFGIVLTEVILEDALAHGNPPAKLKSLKNKTREIYMKTVPLMQGQDYWNNLGKYLVRPELWAKPLKYKLAEFRMSYAMRSRVDALFSQKTYENFTEGFSDRCLQTVINSTIKQNQAKILCKLDAKCEQFIEGLDQGSGYILTHKLLLLQVAKVRKCKMHPKIYATAVKKVCTAIYTELLSLDYYKRLDESFDLILEEILLCGYEGFADFLKLSYLERIFVSQQASGCFKIEKRRKREANIFEDGCADHTTGLAAGVLSLYLNYLLKNAETLVLISEWF